ncbi:hypothetical protein ACHAWF_017567 [Thalassiosira exigua]
MIGETRMNKSSSRSHCLFTIKVHGRIALGRGDGDMEFKGKLHLVDLAGSECAKSAGNEKGAPDAAARERERMNINRSLLTLGRVITVLKEKSLGRSTGARIPYRDSKLTRVLQEALGGRCKTVIVATISPSVAAIEETASTLNYAHSANGIVNKPVSSSLIALGEMGSMSGGTNDSGDAKSPGDIESWQEMEMRLGYMQAQVDEAQAALARKHLQQQELQERADKVEGELMVCQQKLHDANEENEALEGKVEVESNKRKEAEGELQRTRISLKKTEAILMATRTTERSLTSEAQALIGTLEDALRDRDGVHALLASQRDAEAERRGAAKEFREMVLAVLNNIETSFSDLRRGIEAGQTGIVSAANTNHDVGTRSVAETMKVLSDMAENVACVTESIKAQIAGEGGIVPTAEAGSSSVMRELQLADKALIRGEKSLEEYSKATRRRLEECSKRLEEQSSSLRTSTGQALQSFEARVGETKKTITQVVMRIKSSLANLSEAKAEKTRLLDHLVEQWKEQSIANSKTVIDASTSGSASLQSSMEEFIKDMRNHEDVKKSLEGQRSFLGDAGSAHMQTIDEQGVLLGAHRRKLAESQDASYRLQEEVMRSILSGVQTLVSSEMEKLSAAGRTNFKDLDQHGADLAGVNERITQSAKEVMENVQSTNQLILEKSGILSNSDTRASKAMKSTYDTLEEVIASTSAHHNLTADFASQSLASISEMKHLDGQNADVVKMAERDGKAASTSLVNSVFKPTSVEMKRMLQTSTDNMTFVCGDVIPNMNSDLKDASESQQVVANEMSTKMGCAQSQLSDMMGQVTSIAKSQFDVAEKLGSRTVATKIAHEQESVPYYCAELDLGRDTLISTMNHVTETSSRSVLEGKAQGSAAKKSVEDFADIKMDCNAPVDPVPSMRECSFSHDLSSTPAEEVILQGIDFDSSQTQTSTLSCVEVARGASGSPTLDVDSSHDSQEDNDAASRKSSGSISSLPSPRLKFRDINVYHGDTIQAGLKSRRQHRSTNGKPSSVSRKNKCPSGMTIPSMHSRKRSKR